MKGEKIARMLDNKIRDHLANGGMHDDLRCATVGDIARSDLGSLQDLHGGKACRPTAGIVQAKNSPGLQSASCNDADSQSSPATSQPALNGALSTTSSCLQETSETHAVTVDSPPQAKVSASTYCESVGKNSVIKPSFRCVCVCVCV